VISGNHLLEFILASAAIILVPGPSVMFTIARAVAWGRGTAMLTVVGNALGMVVLSTLIAIGLGPALQRSHTLLVTVQAAGGLYLIYLGWQALKHRQEHADDMVALNESKPSNWQTVRQGFMVGVLNPKALVFFAAIFPQFVEPEAGSVTVQLLVFGLIFAGLAVLLDGSWALIVGTSRDWFVTSRNRLVFLRTVGGVVMVLLGIFVLIPVVLGLFE
jgi:threonine/homoserine/homoserine lactone efflux protein